MILRSFPEVILLMFQPAVVCKHKLGLVFTAYVMAHAALTWRSMTTPCPYIPTSCAGSYSAQRGVRTASHHGLLSLQHLRRKPTTSGLDDLCNPSRSLAEGKQFPLAYRAFPGLSSLYC